MNGTTTATDRFARYRRPLIFGLILALIAGVVVLIFVEVSSNGPVKVGSGYGISKSANYSHELAGVEAAAHSLWRQTNGQVAIDTSRSSLVFAEEHSTATADVKVGHCTVVGTFHNVPFETNTPLKAADVGALSLVGSDGATVTVAPTKADQLAVIANSPLGSCLVAPKTTARPVATG